MAVNLKYFLKESTSSMRRNMALTIAAIMVTSLSLILLGTVGMLVHGGNGVADMMKKKVSEVSAFLKSEISKQEQESLHRYIQNLPGVKKVEYISKEEALKEFKDMFKDQPDMIAEIEENPLPASFKIITQDPKYNNSIAEALKKRNEISKDDRGRPEIQNPKDVVDKVVRITDNIKKIGFAVVIAFGLVSVALVSITIRMAIYSRRKEIGIMKLVGATNWFIRWPFILEGIFEGFVGALVGIVATILLHNLLITKFEVAFSNTNLISTGYLVVLSVVLVVIGMFVGAIGSIVALIRHMEV